jgi:hypothetical protein
MRATSTLIPSGRGRFLLVGAVLVGVALPAGVDAAGPQFSNLVWKDRNTVEQMADKRIGRHYACAVATRPTKERRRTLLIYVTSEAAARRARDLRSELDRPGRARVRMASDRFRKRRMEKIRSRVEAVQPNPTETATSFETSLGKSRCPRVEITLRPKGEATAETETWAAAVRARFGRDRVVVRRADLELH